MANRSRSVTLPTMSALVVGVVLTIVTTVGLAAWGIARDTSVVVPGFLQLQTTSASLDFSLGAYYPLAVLLFAAATWPLCFAAYRWINTPLHEEPSTS